MQAPARHSLAVIGAGPIGLEVAAAALEHGFDVHVFERGEVGAHLLAWGHVRMFTPWRMNVGPASARLLQRSGWTAPDPEGVPTGAEMVGSLLAPLAATAELRDRVHAHSQVVHVARRGALKGEWIGDPERRRHPFRLLVRDAGGRENVLHAFAVVDASGVYGSPNRAGTGGIPARGESYLAPQMSYRCDDVAGLRRERHAGRRTLVIGGGATAATTVVALSALAAEAGGTSVAWATRSTGGPFAGEVSNDPLPGRAALYAAAHALQRGETAAVTWIGGAEVEGFEFNSATHRYRVALAVGEASRVEEVDEVVVNTGFGPDDSLYRELQVHECYASRGPMKLSAALLGAAGADCVTAPAGDADTLSNPEPDFFILGAKAYARYNTFLLATGYAQAGDVVARLAHDLLEPAAP
jgi:cation diffusion facilitator CzcD-associated flavoprotein CzcO